ncbi:unnamed protein product [Rhodiola kirilowii]
MGSNSSLSDMVNSFLEKDLYEGGQAGLDDDQRDDEDGDPGENQDELAKSNWETKIELRRLMCMEKKRSLLAEVDKAKRALEDSTSFSSSSLSGFSRQLMSRLRARGLDAGLCKSRWQNQGGIPAGAYEYIDIVTDNTRYIVELSLADHFNIARPTSHYATLLETVPEIFIGTAEEMKQVVKLMCQGMKVSMGSRDMKVPPWRKYEYMKAKWFGSYKRTTKAVVPTKESVAESSCRERSVGFDVVVQNPSLSGFVKVVNSTTCRGEMSRKKTRMEYGLLAAVLQAEI